MEPKDIIIFIFGFVSAWIINFTTHIFAKIRDQKNNFLRVSEDLIKPFLESKSIFDLNTRGIHERSNINDTFIKLHSDQKRSINTIIQHIPSWKRTSLRTAWGQYEKNINNDNPSAWFTSENLYKDDPDIIKKRKKLTKQLDSIIFFFDYHNMFSVFKIFK